MYGPDSYLYETNLALLATLSEEELADPTIVAQLAASALPLAGMGEAIVSAAARALTIIAAWFAPATEEETATGLWMYPPLY